MLRLHAYAFHRPRNLEAALELLAAHPEDAMLIAGGTDVMPNMKHQLFTPNHVIGIKQLPELHGVRITDDELVIGSGETAKRKRGIA